MGFEPSRVPSGLETVNEFTERIKSATEEAKSAIRKAQKNMTLKGAKETISLAQAKDAVPGPNCMLKSLWG